MKKHGKSLNLKKFRIAKLNQKFIFGGTDSRTNTTTDQSIVVDECTLHSMPIKTCTSIGQLKSLEALGGTCTDADQLDTQNPAEGGR